MRQSILQSRTICCSKTEGVSCARCCITPQDCAQAYLVPASVKAYMLQASATLITPHLNAYLPDQTTQGKRWIQTRLSVYRLCKKGSVRTAVLQQTTAGSVESGKQRSFSRPVFDRGSLCLLATPTFTWLFCEQTLHPHGGNGTR